MPWVDEISTSGRLNRSGFWLRHCLVLPVAIFLCIATTQVLGSPIDLLPALLTTAFLVSVWGRRLHDRGRRAWWLLLAAIPVVGALFLLFECGLRGSSPAANRYGQTPGIRHDYVTVGADPRTEQAQ